MTDTMMQTLLAMEAQVRALQAMVTALMQQAAINAPVIEDPIVVPGRAVFGKARVE